MFDNFDMIPRLRFKSAMRDLFSSLPSDWRISVSVWNPSTGEAWEGNPRGSVQKERARERVVCAEVSRENELDAQFS